MQLTNIIRTISLIGAFVFVTLSPPARAACQEGCDFISGNTFLGDFALINNTTGFDNTAIGSSALIFNTTGSDNTANGAAALQSNKTGNNNTASGALALFENTTGHDNMANGYSALSTNTTGDNNTANGFFALLARGVFASASRNENRSHRRAAVRMNRCSFSFLFIFRLISLEPNFPSI